MSNLTKSILIVLLILLVDQIFKIWVKTHMLIGENSYENWGWAMQWAQLRFIENNGMAFGILPPGKWGKIILSLFRIVASIAIMWYIVKLTRKDVPIGYIISLSMILAGALGNLIDSSFYGMIFSESPDIYSGNSPAVLFPDGGGYAGFLQGKVVDMLYFPMINGTIPDWSPIKAGQQFIFFQPIFNISDSAITTGVAMILVFQRRFFKKMEDDKNLVKQDIEG